MIVLTYLLSTEQLERILSSLLEKAIFKTQEYMSHRDKKIVFNPQLVQFRIKITSVNRDTKFIQK